MPTFEKHLREQARWLGVPVSLNLGSLRQQIEEALRAALRERKLPIEGTARDMRERLRRAEVLETAGRLGIRLAPGQGLEDATTAVFARLRAQLREARLPQRGSLYALSQRLAKHQQSKAAASPAARDLADKA